MKLKECLKLNIKTEKKTKVIDIYYQMLINREINNLNQSFKHKNPSDVLKAYFKLFLITLSKIDRIFWFKDRVISYTRCLLH